MSAGLEKRPKGMPATNFSRFSGVSAMPMKVSSKPVSPMTGQMALTRMPSGASSTARDLVRMFTAPLVLLYTESPGLGRSAAVEEVLTHHAATARAESRKGHLDGQVDRLHVDREEAIELRLLNILEGLVAMADTGVVDQDIEAAEFGLRRVQTGSQVVTAGDIGSHRQGPAAGASNRLGHRFTGRTV